jgi:hypothetical protein
MHALPQAPHAAALYMRDQHQRGRRKPGRGAAIGGVAGEQLAQPRVAEMAAQPRPQRGERPQPGQRRQAAGAQAGGHAQQPRALRAHVRPFQPAIDTAGLVAEAAVALSLGGTGEAADGVDRSLQVGVQIHAHGAAAAAPGVARQHRQRLQFDQRLQRAAALRQQFVEHPAHREHGGAGIDARAIDFELAHLAAGRRRGVEQRHLHAALRQQQRARQAADAGADDDDAAVAQRGFSHS